MDLHDVARGRGGVAEALARIGCPSVVAAVRSDALYPPYQQHELFEALSGTGTPGRSPASTFVEIDSPHGHDGFLIETEQLAAPMARLLERAFGR